MPLKCSSGLAFQSCITKGKPQGGEMFSRARDYAKGKFSLVHFSSNGSYSPPLVVANKVLLQVFTLKNLSPFSQCSLVHSLTCGAVILPYSCVGHGRERGDCEVKSIGTNHCLCCLYFRTVLLNPRPSDIAHSHRKIN